MIAVFKILTPKYDPSRKKTNAIYWIIVEIYNGDLQGKVRSSKSYKISGMDSQWALECSNSTAETEEGIKSLRLFKYQTCFQISKEI